VNASLPTTLPLEMRERKRGTAEQISKNKGGGKKKGRTGKTLTQRIFEYLSCMSEQSRLSQILRVAVQRKALGGKDEGSPF